MPNFKRTEDLTLQLLKGQTHYKYQRSVGIIDEERFFNLVCRKTHDTKGNPVPLVDKEGKPVYYQLQYFLDSDSDVINDEQKQLLLQDPTYQGSCYWRDKDISVQTTARSPTRFNRSQWKRMVGSFMDVGRITEG